MPSWWAVAAAVVVAALVTTDLLLRGALFGGALLDVDHTVSHAMRAWGVRFDPWPMRLTYLLTLPGQRGTVLVLTVPTVAYLTWRGRATEPVVRFVVALAVLTGLVYALKSATGRSAPPVDAVRTAAGASFPSGHLANAVIVWGTVAFVAAGTAWTPAGPATLVRVLRLAVWVAPAAVFVGMTVLDYHWFSDFVGGLAVGMVGLRLAELAVWGRLAAGLDRRLSRGRDPARR